MTWAGFEATTGLDMEKIPFTQVGLDRLKEELNSLKHTERQAVIKAIAEVNCIFLFTVRDTLHHRRTAKQPTRT